jgi:hypothetical protein
MHKSKLSGFIIDCQSDDLHGAAAFWGHALGMPVHSLPPAESGRYERLEDRQHGLQAVSRWWVMEAPTGQRFCVVKADSPDFERLANEWP